jgi:hypothetical protein
MAQLISIDEIYLLAAYLNAVVESVADDEAEFWVWDGTSSYFSWMKKPAIDLELSRLRKTRKTLPGELIIQAELNYYQFTEVDARDVTIDEYNLMVLSEPGELKAVHSEDGISIVELYD